MAVGGTPDPAIVLPRAYAAYFSTYGYEAACAFGLGSDKNIYGSQMTYDEYGPYTFSDIVGAWTTGTAANYDVRATVLEGSVYGPLGTWLNLGTRRDWGTVASSIGSVTAKMTIEFRNASTLQLVMLSGVTLTAERYS